MQEKVEIITKHIEQFWTKIPKNGYCVKEGLVVEHALTLSYVGFLGYCPMWGGGSVRTPP